jgi:hypothetical protein
VIRFLPVLVFLALLVGCARTFPTADTRMEGAEAQFDIPPKELVSRLKQALSEPPINIGVVEEGKGSILTGYQSFSGTMHVARRWQERTRYRIRVIPDFDQPTQRSQMVITESTEERAAEGMKWETRDVLPRPERAKELLRQLEPKLKSGGGATATPMPT